MKLRCSVALAVLLIGGCGKSDNPLGKKFNYGFFSPPIVFELGDRLRVEGLLISDDEGNFALRTRGGTDDYSNWDCVALEGMSWTQKLFLPLSYSSDFQDRSFEAVGQVRASHVTFGRGDGIQHGPRHCLVSINVESIKRLEISDDLARKLKKRTEYIVQ